MAESTRTKKIREAPVDDDMPMIKRAVKAAALGASKLGDKLGFTQEEEYKKEPVKKAKGGSVSKRADGCAMKGKTRGRMV